MPARIRARSSPSGRSGKSPSDFAREAGDEGVRIGVRRRQAAADCIVERLVFGVRRSLRTAPKQLARGCTGERDEHGPRGRRELRDGLQECEENALVPVVLRAAIAPAKPEEHRFEGAKEKRLPEGVRSTLVLPYEGSDERLPRAGLELGRGGKGIEEGGRALERLEGRLGRPGALEKRLVPPRGRLNAGEHDVEARRGSRSLAGRRRTYRLGARANARR